jgi:ABC-type glycerol-3-phosphate transport system substrate-binding protein
MLPKIGVGAVPAGPKGQFNVAYVRDGFAIFDTGSDKRRNLAKDLMRQLYSKEVYTKWINLAFPSPAVMGMEDLEIWKNPQRKGFLESAKTGVLRGYPGPLTPAFSEFYNRPGVLNMAIRLVVDNWSPEQAIDEMDKVAKDIYGKYA